MKTVLISFIIVIA